MGGAIAEGNVTPAAEFNIYVDPEAAWRVFRSGLPVTMIGLDVTHKALLTDRTPSACALREVGRLVAELYDFFVEYHRRTYGTEGAPIHDAVAVAQVLRPGSWRRCTGTSTSTASRALPGPDGGRPLAADRGGAERGRRRGHRRRGFLDLLCERLGSL